MKTKGKNGSSPRKKIHFSAAKLKKKKTEMIFSFQHFLCFKSFNNPNKKAEKKRQKKGEKSFDFQ